MDTAYRVPGNGWAFRERALLRHLFEKIVAWCIADGLVVTASTKSGAAEKALALHYSVKIRFGMTAFNPDSRSSTEPDKSQPFSTLKVVLQQHRSLVQ